MLTLWNDWALPYPTRGFGDLDALRRQMDALLSSAFEPSRFDRSRAQGHYFRPEMTMHESADALQLVADLPGLSREHVSLTLDRGTLTLSGRRSVSSPKGYDAHRRERADYEFTRSYALPCEVDAEKATATVREGVLTITLPKVPEVKPRRIAISAE